MAREEPPHIHSFGYVANPTVATSAGTMMAGKSHQVYHRSMPTPSPFAEQSKGGKPWPLPASPTHYDSDTLDRAKPLVAAITSLMKEPNMSKVTRRLVQIYVVDPDDQIPINMSMLHKGEPFLTDLTDQELWYDINLPAKLAEHNNYRASLRDKRVKDRDEKLEAIKIRDLSMVVVVLAEFVKP